MSRRLVLAIATVAVLLAGCASGGPSPASGGPAATSSAGTTTAPPGVATVPVAALPPEAADTIRLIEAGGPFPYRQDGGIFENREGLLPDAPRGAYREYTVPTPGEDDRGARRIVTGPDGAMYWTGDHYASFAWIDR